MRLKSARQSNFAVIGAASIFFVAFLAAFVTSSVFSPAKISDATNVVTANINSQGYYVRVNSSDVNMNLLTTPGGAMTVVSSTVKAATNSPAGYKLYLGMSPYNASGTEKSAADKQKNALYLDGDLSRTDGKTLAATSGSAATPAELGDNTWGYAVDKNSTGAPTVWTTLDHTTMSSSTPTTDKFAAVPAVGSEDLIQTTNTANVPVDTKESDIPEGSYTSANLYFGVRGTMAKTSGAYSNTIAYTAVTQAGPQPGSISFDPETYTRDATYAGMTWDDQVTIHTSLYTNMEDLGTATVTLTGGPNNATLTCANPTLASVNNMLDVTCTLPQGYAGTYTVTVNLPKFGQTYTGTFKYAVDTMQHLTLMQEMDSSICSSATVGDSATLTDIRGGSGSSTYTIKKLADNKCWMTQNLRLTGSVTLHDYDSNITGTWTLPVQTEESDDGSAASTTNKWCTAQTQNCEDRAVNLYTNNVDYGTYYTWRAATAGEGTWDVTSGNVSSSVCPKGWRLPTGGSNGEFQSLYNAYPSSAAMRDSSGPALVLSGNRDGGNTLYQNGSGYYWSNTVDSSIGKPFYFALNAEVVYPALSFGKYSGYSVRCVAQ